MGVKRYDCEDYNFERFMQDCNELEALKDLEKIYINMLEDQECSLIRKLLLDVQTRIDRIENKL